MLPEERQRAPPGVVGGRLVVHVGPLVVEEPVIHAGVDVDLRRLARLLDRRVRFLRHLRRHESILFGEEPEHRAGEFRVIRLDVRMDAVEVHGGADVRVERRREQRELAAHAETDGSELRTRRVPGQELVGAAQVLLRLPTLSAMKSLPAVSGSSAVLPWYRSGASAEKPSAAKRSQTFLMWPTRPHHSWITSTPGPLPDGGVAR